MPDLVSSLAGVRGRGHVALLPFIPAGYPDLKTTQALLPALEQAGAAAVEIGIPFSDPIADGPTIQAAFSAALAKGLTVADVFAAVREVRPRVGIPLVAMVSFSIVYRYGAERFAREARAAGFDGLILPDLPPPEAAGTCAQVQAAGLQTTLLVAPTTSEARRREITRLCSGFVYYLSVSGTTGARDRLPEDIAANLRQLRGLTGQPICVGFGISRPEHLAQLKGLADGAIVGSAIVKRMTQVLEKTPGATADALAAEVAAYCRGLVAGGQ